jgi:hypothetical protein
VRIPLDYYRILGLPIQATPDQLHQAHHDRTLQLPRREFSDAVIGARRELLDQAYNVLSNPETRKAYDANFLTNTYELVSSGVASLGESTVAAVLPESSSAETSTPHVEISDQQFVGALLILHELGEYELVLELGRPFLVEGRNRMRHGHYGDPAIAYTDIILTVSLSCMELGREQWQQGQYENAAEALETGQQLLLREGVFPGVRGEIQSDLYRLRPYRILELVATPEETSPRRQQGLRLLQDMLNERGGIDGAGNDQSGLTIDDFLRFVQQLRGYLTSAEQQALFEQEAARPSAVATYLTVYTLLARGFANLQPELVHQAKSLLARLSVRQDVHLEQAISSLLLGQTEQASQSLEHSQEYEPITFIRANSQGAPDLLPGLCLYTEQWFQEEVFPHFRDLAQRTASLKDYFADAHVQAYLEAIPSEGSAASTSPSTIPVTPRPEPAAEPPQPLPLPTVPAAVSPYQPSTRPSDASLIEAARARIAARGGAVGTTSVSQPLDESRPVPEAERVGERFSSPAPGSAYQPATARPTATPPGVAGSSGSMRRGSMPISETSSPSRFRGTSTPRWLPLALLAATVALGLLLAGLIRAWQTAKPRTVASPTPSPVVSPSMAPSPALPAVVLTKDSAKQVLEEWFLAKSKAMGERHQIDALETILVEPKLSEWRQRAETAKRDGWHGEYTHKITVESVEMAKSTIAPETSTPTESTSSSPTATNSPSVSQSPTSPATDVDLPSGATVVAQIQEQRDGFVNGETDAKTSSKDDLTFRYQLVREDGEWRIKDWQEAR